MPLNGFRGAALVCVLLASGCTAQPTLPRAMSLTEGASLTPTDDIDELDVATDARGDVHVVWRERSNVYQGDTISERLVYRHGSGAPLQWGPRVVVAEGGSTQSVHRSSQRAMAYTSLQACDCITGGFRLTVRPRMT